MIDRSNDHIGTVDVHLVKAAADKVAEAQILLSKAIAHQQLVRSLGGRSGSGYSIVIAGRSVDVSAMDGNTYDAKMIRGREMIHLGVLKVLDVEICSLRDRLAHAESHLAFVASAGVAK